MCYYLGMKVGELIEQLSGVDPEMEILAAPLIAVPVMSMQKDAKSGVDRIASPFMRYAIESVAMHRDMIAEGEPECILIGFNEDVQKEVPSEEFVN